MLLFCVSAVVLVIIRDVVSFKLRDIMLEKEIGGRFKLHKHLGSGTYGSVYSAFDKTNQNLVAVKLEKIITTNDNRKVHQEDTALDIEYRRYKTLEKIGMCISQKS